MSESMMLLFQNAFAAASILQVQYFYVENTTTTTTTKPLIPNKLG
jgi:hypothetical protein